MDHAAEPAITAAFVALMDALDRRINSNTLLVRLSDTAGVAPATEAGARFQSWLDGPHLAADIARAEASRGWCNGYDRDIDPTPVSCPLQPITADEFRQRLWWLLQESQSYYQVPLSAALAGELIAACMAALAADRRPAQGPGLYDVDCSVLGGRLRRYFDSTSQDSATLLRHDGGWFLLLTNGSP